MYLVSGCSVEEDVVFIISLRILQGLSGMPIFSIVKLHAKARIDQGRIKRSRQGNMLASSEKGWKPGLGNNAFISHCECL